MQFLSSWDEETDLHETTKKVKDRRYINTKLDGKGCKNYKNSEDYQNGKAVKEGYSQEMGGDNLPIKVSNHGLSENGQTVISGKGLHWQEKSKPETGMFKVMEI